MQDYRGIQNAMSDFADVHGDQTLITAMKLWLNENMGGLWNIHNMKLEDGECCKLARLQAIVECSEMLADISKNYRNNGDVSSILSDIMIGLVRMFKGVKWPTTR